MMPQLRKDYILDRYVIIAGERAKRPDQFRLEQDIKGEDVKCFFCPGNEVSTPPEIYRTEKDGRWQMRVFDNKFPAVQAEGNTVLETHDTFFTFADAVGKHEVIVETPEHVRQLWDLEPSDIAELFRVYIQRIKAIISLEHVKYVLVFKNHKKNAGTSIVHSHSQVIGYNLVPGIIREKEAAVSRYQACPYCSIIGIEKGGDRRIAENSTSVSFAPYASASPFEAWIFPKRHVISFHELDDQEIAGMAELLSKLLKKLRDLNIAFNYYLHYGVKDMHFHIVVMPRTSIRAGFEFGTETIINSMPPEKAAEYYRS